MKRLGNSGGFTLIEVVSALLILSIMTAGAVPAATALYEERFEIDKEYEALHLLLLEGYTFHGREDRKTINGIEYRLFNRNGLVCVSWMHRLGKEKEQCLEFP